MPAVLRISGPYEQLQKSMQEITLPFTESWASKRGREKGISHDGNATFNLTVSEWDGDHVPAQIDESTHYLSRHKAVLRRLAELPGVEILTLDFSWNFPLDSIGQFNRFSCSFMRLCCSLGIDIKVSVYATSERDGLEFG